MRGYVGPGVHPCLSPESQGCFWICWVQFVKRKRGLGNTSGSKFSQKFDLKLKDLRYPNHPKTKEGPIFLGGDVCELPLRGCSSCGGKMEG